MKYELDMFGELTKYGLIQTLFKNYRRVNIDTVVSCGLENTSGSRWTGIYNMNEILQKEPVQKAPVLNNIIEESRHRKPCRLYDYGISPRSLRQR